MARQGPPSGSGRCKVAAKLAGNKLSEKIMKVLGDKASPELKDAQGLKLDEPRAAFHRYRLA
jgi:hypothetical protein